MVLLLLLLAALVVVGVVLAVVVDVNEAGGNDEVAGVDRLSAAD